MALASIALATSAIGGAVSAYSQYNAGKAQQAAAEHNAQVARNQAELTNQEARENSKRQRKNNEKSLASMRARLASQGTGLDSGAPIAVLGDTAGELELSVLDGYRQAEGRRAGLLSSARMSQYQGKQARSAGKINAFGSLLGTGVSTYSKYQGFKDSGVFDKKPKSLLT